VSAVRSDNEESSTGIEFHILSLAFCSVGGRSCGTLTKRKGGMPIHCSSRRLLHQVGRGRGLSKNNGRECLEFLVEIDRVPTCHPAHLCYRQRHAIRLQLLLKWCAELRIRYNFSTPFCPKANGQVEATNKTLLTILKKKLEDQKDAWVDYFPEVLWSYRTTTRTPTGATSFSFTFGAKAVIPVEVGSLSYRVSHYNPGLNSEGLKLHLDLLEERRDQAELAMAAYQRKTELYYNKTVWQRRFGVGDWVLRKVTLAT